MKVAPGVESDDAHNGVVLQSVVVKDPDKPSTGETDSNKCLDDVVEASYDGGPCVRYVEKIETVVHGFFSTYWYYAIPWIKVILLLAYLAYFGYCMYYRFGDEGSIVLLAGTSFVLFIISYKFLRSRCATCSKPHCLETCMTSPGGTRIRKFMRFGLYIVALVALGLFLGLDILKSHPRNSQSLLGIVVFIVICFLLSRKPSRVNWHPVFWGFMIQFLFALLTLRTDFGYNALKWIGDLVQTFIRFSDKGSAFVLGENFKSMGLAFTASGVLIWFNSMIFLLNHWGIIKAFVVTVGHALSLCLETGPIESIVAAANIFMGLTEVPLLIRPYLPTLSKSELSSVMTCGFASVAGAYMALFISFGIPANHLLTAALISAPAGLAFAKLMDPETEPVNFAAQTNVQTKDTSVKQNIVSALSSGAVMAVKIVVPVMVNIIAFFALQGLVDALLDWFGQRAGFSGLTFELICSYVFYPLAFVMGAEPADCRLIGSILGIKLVATNVVAYVELGKIIQNRHDLNDHIAAGNGTWYWSDDDIILTPQNVTLVKGIMSERSEVITTYAICGFSAFVSVGICIGTMIPMCPSRKQDIIDLVLITFFAGNVASYATGAVAGLMYSDFSMASPLGLVTVKFCHSDEKKILGLGVWCEFCGKEMDTMTVALC